MISWVILKGNDAYIVVKRTIIVANPDNGVYDKK